MDKQIKFECYFGRKDQFDNFVFNIDKNTFDGLVKVFGSEKVPFHTFPFNGKTLYNLKIKGKNIRCDFTANPRDKLEVYVDFFAYDQGNPGISCALFDYDVLKKAKTKDDFVSL